MNWEEWKWFGDAIMLQGFLFLIGIIGGLVGMEIIKWLDERKEDK